MKHIRTTTHTSYYLTYEGFHGHFNPQGYSQYYKRISLQDAGRLPAGEEVYGYAQALAHIEELRKSEHNGTCSYADTIFQIEIVSTITTCIIPNEGIPATKIPVTELDRFYVGCTVVMFDLEMQRHLHGTVTQITPTEIVVQWRDEKLGQLSTYPCNEEDIKHIRVI